MTVRSFHFTIGLIGLLLACADASAYSPPWPKRHDVYSPNMAFVIDIDPVSEMNTVYAVDDRSHPIWSFPGSLYLCKVFLSNDGEVVAILGWKYVREQDIPNAGAIEFRNKDGVFKSYTLRELCPNPKRTQEVGPGPIGDFWRTWYSPVDSNGERFVMSTTDRYEYEFRFSDGQMTDRSSLWVNAMRDRLEENALPLGLACLSGFWVLFLALRYWKRRRDARRATSVVNPPANPSGQ